MAAVLEPKDPAAKHNSQVDEQIAQATSRIRAHDLTFGGLTLAALVLGYAAVMILLDKYFNLPAWLRQVSLFGFVAAFAATAYLTLFRPLRKRINPLYAAKQVEGTLEDPKNSVTGYVDAREKGDLNATVKAALASRAAKAAAEADVNRAVDHRSLVWLGGTAIALLLTLIVLFFVFRPTQFASLASRAFMPFKPTVIASRTVIQLVKPDPPELTITTGQSVTVAVEVSGKVPSADGPDKVRLFVRQSQSDPNYDELPMAQGATSREWELRVPDHLVNNGFWYKVVGGDAETPEYQVTVRTLPRFDTFQVSYEYPKYLRLAPFSNTDPVLKGPRGTTVTLLAKANRPVRDGLMVAEPGTGRANGVPDASDPNTLKFVYKLADSGKYKLSFTSTGGERMVDPFQGAITVEVDRAPQLLITAPEPDETEQPANGQQTIEGKIGDDYGIDTVTLKMRTVGATARQLPDVPFLNGKSNSFRREKDDTYPTDVDYKGSIDFAKITKDTAGLDVTLTPGTVIEYWLEATDNCTEPKPNVGVSNKKIVRLGASRTEMDDKKQLDDQKQQRKEEEQKHNAEQQKKLDSENRDRKNDKAGDKPEPKTGDKGDAPPKNADAKNPPNDPMSPKDDPKSDPNAKGTPGMGTDTKPPADGEKPPPKSDPKGDGKSEPKGDANKDIDQTARDIQKELDRENRDGASGKPNNMPPPDGERPEPAKSKPQPKDGANGNPESSEAKPEPKTDPMNPMGKNDAAPSDGKPQGEPKKPEDPATPKPEPKQPNPMGGKNDAAPSENRDPATGSAPGTDKQPPKEPQPKAPDAKTDPNSGATTKPTEPKKDGNPKGTPNGDPKTEPPPAGMKPNAPEPARSGADKPSDQPQPKDPNGKQAEPKPGAPEAGDAKPDRAPPAGGAKPAPKDGPMPKDKDADAKPAAGANDPMRPNETNAADAKPAPAEPKKGEPGAKPREVGGDKPQPKDADGEKTPNGGTAPPPKEKLDPKQMEELQNAAKDLAGKDEKKKQEARDKLDKAVGKDKRQELEKLAEDLQSKDDATRKAAEQKVKDAMEKAKGGEPKKDDPKGPNGSAAKEPKKDEAKTGASPKELTPEEKKDIENAVKDLQSDDPAKKEAAQKKLDQTVGEQNRKDAEQLMKDLKSDDPMKKAAAQKKLDDIKKQMEDQAKKDGKGGANDAKGKDPSPEELADLAKKAQDLQSKDEQTRQKAQKELDDQLGKEQRQKLEEMMKNQKSDGSKEDAEKLKKQLEEMAKGRGKKPDDDYKPMGGGTPPANKPMEEAKSRREAAELTLENLKKDENRKKIQDKKGWTDAEYEKFLKDLEEHVKGLREQEKDALKPPVAPMPKSATDPRFAPGTGGKVDSMGGASGSAGVGGTTAPPPGFEGARNKFQDALKKKP